METQPSGKIPDALIISAANVFNLLMVGIFYARTRGASHPLSVGFIWSGLIILVAAAGVINLQSGRDWWSYILPLILILFLALELLLDYILRIEFRSTTLLAPYLILYYVAILGMIGYAFLSRKIWGYFTLATYFLSQIAALYSYFLVGHG